MSPSTTRNKALAGGIAGVALVLALGVAAVAQMGDSGPATPAASVSRAGDDPATPVLVPAETPAAAAEAPTTTAAPAPAPTTTAPAAKAAAPSTTATTKKPAAPATTAPAAPVTAPTTVPAAPKLPPGQRVPYTTAGVQAAASALTQRIPLFKPNDTQLRTFADAVCTSFDQGQTMAQVQATVRDAVSRVQGASLSAADAAFAVQLVVQLRCPGYLP